MIEEAAAHLSLDLTRSWMVGDGWVDVEAGVSAGAKSILLLPRGAEPSSELPASAARPDAMLNNLMEAAGWILRGSSSR